MRRLLGGLLIVHGLAHIGAGTWVYGVTQSWLVTGLWLMATIGFLAAGVGLLGVPVLERHWHTIVASGALASLALLALYGRSDPVIVVGSGIDGAILIASIPFVREMLPRWIGTPAHPPHRRLSSSGTVLALLLLAYPVALIALRPWYTHWGVSRGELVRPLPGDDLLGGGNYRLDHGLTIHAPASAIWPWIVQMGQDRGGFYSYDWLERLVGDPVHNAERIVPEWQSINAGDLVRAVPPTYLGGIFGRDAGWRVLAVMPNRALVLQGWGAFVLEPMSDTTTRLLVRTRAPGLPSFLGVPLAPLNLMVFEPAHFIMQRRMLLGIKERSERSR